MLRSLKVPFIALLVALAFTAYLLGPERFRTQKVALPAKPVKGASLAGVTPARERFDGRTGAAPGKQRRERRQPNADEKYAQVLDDLQDAVQRAKLRRAAHQGVDAEVRVVRGARERLAGLEAEVAASFQATSQRIHDQKLPAVLQERNFAAETAFVDTSAELGRLLDTAGDDRQLFAALDRLGTFFDQHRQGGPVQPLDPSRLPFRSPARGTRAPATTAAGFPKGIRAAAALTSGGGDPNLAPTEDAQITPEIQALANSLGKNPIRIYQWVHDNVVFLPTYGSVQGSAVTLAAKRGNSFDISSLLVALLRASSIPARYVYGTIDVTAARASNWAGGISVLAAQQLFGQGGIPSVAVVSGTSVESLRIEHVWVEAFVDFVPSRGAVNVRPDTWVPLDASFKQYQLITPTDIKSAIPVDVPGTASNVASTALIDSLHGSITGFDQGTLDLLADTSTENIDFQYGRSPDLSRFQGARSILPTDTSVLPGSLPNPVIARAATWSEIPDNLRHKVTAALYNSDLDRAFGSPALSFTISLPALSGRKLGVTYVPATAADAATLAAFKTGTSTSLPVYLVQLQPSLRIDDAEVALGPAVTMGTQQAWDAGLIDPTTPAGDIHTYNRTAGDEIVFGIDAQGVSQDTIHQRFQQRTSDTASENLFTVSLYYWGQYDVLGQSAAVADNAAIQRLPSIGVFAVPLTVGYFFGFPRTGHWGSRQMDVARSIFAVVDKNDGDTVPIERVLGNLGSLLEGRTFDGLFNRAAGTGVSAVQLLREANEQQIPIFRVTQANFASIAPQLSVSASILSDISNAVAVGKTALVPQRAPVHGNWSGVGYIIEDPATGAAAYLINGGAAGGSDDPCNPESPDDPVKVPIIEILIILIIILLLILLLLFLPEIIAAIAGILGGLGELGPAAAAILLALGLAATPTAASAAPPPLPGDGMVPPGDCTPAQYATLVAGVAATCKSGPSCKTTDCGVMAVALTRLQGCVAARDAINTTCFRGGDQAHIDERDAAQRAVDNCACRIARLCP
jgi:hypothetical protein